DLDIVGAGIDDAADLFAVPVHDEQDELAVHLVRLPVPQPGALDGMPLLSDGGDPRRERQSRNRRTRRLRHRAMQAPFDQLQYHTITSIRFIPPAWRQARWPRTCATPIVVAEPAQVKRPDRT